MSQRFSLYLVILAWLLCPAIALASSPLLQLWEYGNYRLYLVQSGVGALEISDSGELDFFKREGKVLLSLLQFNIPEKMPQDILTAFNQQKNVNIYLRSSWGNTQGLFIDPSDEVNGKKILGDAFSSNVLSLVISPYLFTSKNYLALLSHEFFHALHHFYSQGEAAWIREGLAQLFETEIMGHFNAEIIGTINHDLTTSLNGGYNLSSPSPSLYSHHALFFHYLKQKCFSGAFPWELVTTTSREWRPLIAKNCPKSSLEEMALDFELARFLNKVQFGSDLNLISTYSLELDFDIMVGNSSEAFSKQILLKDKLIEWAPLYLNPRDPALRKIVEMEPKNKKIYYVLKSPLGVQLNLERPSSQLIWMGTFIINAPDLIP